MDKRSSLKEITNKSPHQPNAQIIKALDGGKFPFKSNLILGPYAGYLAGKEFLRCLDLVKNRCPYEYTLPTLDMTIKIQDDLMGVQSMIQRKEKSFKDELETLSENVIRSIYDIPAYISLKSCLDNKHNMDELDTEEEKSDFKLNPNRVEYINEQIQKRIILNALVHGSAMHVWKGMHYIVKKKIDKMDPMLFDLYDSYIAITSIQCWMFNLDVVLDSIRNDIFTFSGSGYWTQGYAKLDFEKPGIEAHGVNFPLLLHEMNKGAIDFLISKGIPSDVSEEELKYIYSKADKYEDEVFHYYLSPTLWSDLLDALDYDTQNLPEVISKLSLLNLKDLTDVLKSVISNTDKTKLSLHKII
jgi:hypothetical protein